jgi:hypothetical protein
VSLTFHNDQELGRGTELSQAPMCSVNPPFPVNQEGEAFGSLIAGHTTNITAIPDDADLLQYDSLKAQTPPPRNQSAYERVAAARWNKFHISPSHWPHATSGRTAGGPQDPLDRVGELPINQQHATSARSTTPDDLASSHGEGEVPVVIGSRDLRKWIKDRKLVKGDPSTMDAVTKLTYLI